MTLQSATHLLFLQSGFDHLISRISPYGDRCSGKPKEVWDDEGSGHEHLCQVYLVLFSSRMPISDAPHFSRTAIPFITLRISRAPRTLVDAKPTKHIEGGGAESD